VNTFNAPSGENAPNCRLTLLEPSLSVFVVGLSLLIVGQHLICLADLLELLLSGGAIVRILVGMPEGRMSHRGRATRTIAIFVSSSIPITQLAVRVVANGRATGVRSAVEPRDVPLRAPLQHSEAVQPASFNRRWLDGFTQLSMSHCCRLLLPLPSPSAALSSHHFMASFLYAFLMSVDVAEVSTSSSLQEQQRRSGVSGLDHRSRALQPSQLSISHPCARLCHSALTCSNGPLWAAWRRLRRGKQRGARRGERTFNDITQTGC